MIVSPFKIIQYYQVHRTVFIMVITSHSVQIISLLAAVVLYAASSGSSVPYLILRNKLRAYLRKVAFMNL